MCGGSMKTFWIVCLLSVISSSVMSAPLGLEFGTPLSSLTALKLKQEKPYSYSTSTLPKGHPDFDDYRLVITPKFGLCKFTGWISNVSTNGFGSNLRQKYESLFEALSAKYGAPQSYDFLQKGSIWHEPREFMTALKKEERSLAAFWTQDKLALPDNIAAITLKAHAISESVGMISLSYSSTKEAECIDWIAEQRNSNL